MARNLNTPVGGHRMRGESCIGDFAQAFGVSLRTLRFYEDKGLLQPRREGTARFYSVADRVRLELILKGKRLGFTLSEIHELTASCPTGSPAAADEPDLTNRLGREQIARQLAHLERQRDTLDGAIAELRTALRRTQVAA